MGQRHQLFVLARINGRYRGLAVVHHQWLYDVQALKRCLEILELFQHPGNRIPLQQELLLAGNLEESFWQETLDPYDSPEWAPFPVISTCLVWL